MPTKQYIKKLNGFYVKDEEARNAIDELSAKHYGTAEFIFPKRWSNAVSHDCNLIKYEGKSILIDCGYADIYSEIKTMFSDNGISTFDYVIITHWDNDHIGNLKSLIAEGYITSETTVFMPAAASGYEDNEIEYRSYFATYNIAYRVPTEGEILNIGSLKLTFTNCDPEELNERYAGAGDFRNLISTVVKIEHYNTVALYTGDADDEAYTRLRENNFVKGTVDLFKIGHHGFNTTTDEQFLQSIMPKYAVQTGEMVNGWENGSFSFSPLLSKLASIGTEIYSCFRHEDYLRFVSDGYGIHTIYGHPFKISTYVENNTDIYVDINATSGSIQDGTSEHPFRELNQALGAIDNYHTRIVTIHLADGNYGLSGDWTPGNRKSSAIAYNISDKRIRIIGNTNDRTAVTVQGFLFANCDVLIEYVTMRTNYRLGIQGYNSNIVANHCLITSEDGETATNYVGASTIGGSLTVLYTEIKNCKQGITASHGARVALVGVTFENITDGIYAPTSSNDIFLTEHDVTINDNVKETLRTVPYNATMLLYSGDGNIANDYTIGEVEIPVNFSELSAIEIELRTSSKRFISTGKLYYPGNGGVIPVNIMLSSTTYIYWIVGEIALSSDNKLTFQNMTRIRQNRSTGEFDYLDYPDNDTYYFKFWNIRGYKDNHENRLI